MNDIGQTEKVLVWKVYVYVCEASSGPILEKHN